MIKFLRNIRRRLLTENKFTKYLVYATGEIVLVVIGILIALQINNWNEKRKLRIEENVILNEIKEGLNSDRIDMEGNIKMYEISRKSIDVILNSFENGLPYHDSLATHFSNTIIRTILSSKEGNFDVLKYKGFEIITNKNLRNRLLNLYDRYYQGMVAIQSGIYIDNSKLAEYSLNHFDKVVGYSYDRITKKGKLSEMRPHNVEELKKDKYYITLLKSREENCWFMIAYYDKILLELGEIIKEIEEELSD